MNSAPGCGRVEHKTGRSERVVGDASSLVEWEVGVRFAGGHDRDTARGESGAQADRECEGDVLFEEIFGDARSGIWPSVGGVDYYREGRLHGQAIGGWRGQRGKVGLARRQWRSWRRRLLREDADRKADDERQESERFREKLDEPSALGGLPGSFLPHSASLRAGSHDARVVRMTLFAFGERWFNRAHRWRGHSRAWDRNRWISGASPHRRKQSRGADRG